MENCHLRDEIKSLKIRIRDLSAHAGQSTDEITCIPMDVDIISNNDIVLSDTVKHTKK